MNPDELMQLSDKKEVILMEAKSPVMADKCYWFKEPVYQQLLDNRQTKIGGEADEPE